MQAQTNQPDQDNGDGKGKHDIGELNSLYFDGDACDQQIFAEMRSNLLLVAGEHYQRRQSSFYKRIRDSRELGSEQKMRLTKNHIQKITKSYANNIMSMNPGVGFDPKIDGDLHQQKICDLNHSLWRDAYSKYNLDDLMDDWCDEFVQTGECIVKIFYDPTQGEMAGYEPSTYPDDHEQAGQPMLDEVGQPIPDMDSPKFTGAFVFEEVFGFNLLRPSECKDIRRAEWLCIRKMVNKKDLLGKFKDPEIQKFIVPSQDETFIVFDGAMGGYKRGSKNQVMVREYYFRPSFQYPKGYYFITTKEGVLAEGVLPGGIFPIVLMPADKVPTTPRGRSPVRIMRPYQAEINRSASKIAEHQVTLGDDKLLIQNGTKVSAGVALPGVRALNYTGMTPVILAGRDGSQYLNYMLAQVKELYEVMMVAEDAQEMPGQLDPYTLLFRSARQKKRFQRYIKRFEKFLIQVVKCYLRLAKFHLSDEELIAGFGKKEQVNIAEYRQSKDVDYDIKIEAQSDDIETKLGKQLIMNHVLQYVGPQLKPEQIGKIYRAMPYSDGDESFDDLLIDNDNSTNEILALDRGEQPPVMQNDNHEYAGKRLNARMRKPDFKYLDPSIQNNYQQKTQIHMQIDAAQKEQIARAEQGFIPTSGLLVPCDFYVQAPGDPTGTKTQRARFPEDALNWLIQQLQAQGTMQNSLKDMPQTMQSGYADQFLKAGIGGQQPGGGAPGGQPPRPQGLPPSSPSGGMSPMGPRPMGGQMPTGPSGPMSMQHAGPPSPISMSQRPPLPGGPAGRPF